MSNFWAPRDFKVHHLKITMLEIKPVVWRRILVPEVLSLKHLHDFIQSAFEWSGCRYWSIGDMGEELNRDAKIKDAFKQVNQEILYTYDIADMWQFVVRLEAIKRNKPGATYPICTAGRQARPPEEVGGVGGYEELRKHLKDPTDEEYEESWEWLRENDSEHYFRPGYRFNPKTVFN